jgi:hypothetical protein
MTCQPRPTTGDAARIAAFGWHPRSAAETLALVEFELL